MHYLQYVHHVGYVNFQRQNGRLTVVGNFKLTNIKYGNIYIESSYIFI